MADPDQREQESRQEDDTKYHQRREQERRERDLLGDQIQDEPLTEPEEDRDR